MAGYTHTCASCEAKLKVHERYVGRALHCPKCGLEFLADPGLADVDDIIEELAPPESRSIPWVALSVILGLVALALILGQAGDEGLFARLFRPTRNPGQYAVLALEGTLKVPAAMDRETVIFVVDAIEDEDPGSLQALRSQGKIIDVGSGTKIKLIEQRKRERTARIRVLEGTWTGRVLWVPLAAVQ